VQKSDIILTSASFIFIFFHLKNSSKLSSLFPRFDDAKIATESTLQNIFILFFTLQKSFT